MAEVRVSNPLVEQFKRGTVPKDLRSMAAQGALPLGPVDLLELLEFLLADREPEIAETASATLIAFDKDELLAVCKDRSSPAPVLAWVLKNRTERDVLESVLQNTTLTDDAVEQAAPRLITELAELVVINQVRLLRRTSLLVAIESNPTLNNDQKRRPRELRETFKIGADHEEKPQAPPPPPIVEAAPSAPEPEAEAAPVEGEQLVEVALSDDEKKQPEKVSLAKRIFAMNMKDKLKTALQGDREARTMLIRDPNRLVAAAVLGSPKLTDAEVEGFAGMKNVSDQVLRTIGNHRDWTKKYSVISNLVRNPRTPLAISIGMVSRLNPKDLKSVSVDKNVPEVIRKQALKFVKGSQEAAGKH
jgi:hypothetical protein